MPVQVVSEGTLVEVQIEKDMWKKGIVKKVDVEAGQLVIAALRNVDLHVKAAKPTPEELEEYGPSNFYARRYPLGAEYKVPEGVAKYHGFDTGIITAVRGTELQVSPVSSIVTYTVDETAYGSVWRVAE